MATDMAKDMANIQTWLSSSAKLSDVMDILPAVETVYKCASSSWDARYEAINHFWNRVDTLSEQFKDADCAAEVPDAFWKINEWWEKRPELRSDASRSLQGRIRRALLTHSLQAHNYDLALRVIQWCLYNVGSRFQTPLIQALLTQENKQGWQLQRKRSLSYSSAAVDVIEWVEKLNWRPPKGVDVEFFVDDIDFKAKTVQFGVRQITLLESAKDTMPKLHLQWLLGFECTSEQLKMKWSAYTDGSGSAEVDGQRISRPMRGMISLDEIFDSRQSIAEKHRVLAQSYSDVQGTCEKHLHHLLDIYRSGRELDE